MGLTSKGNEKVPCQILKDVKVVKIASGADHLVLLSEGGQVYTCGCGEQGQLGRMSQRSAERGNRHGINTLLVPAIVMFKKSELFENIWAGSYCTFAKSNKGDIYAFGLNNYNQIGGWKLDKGCLVELC